MVYIIIPVALVTGGCATALATSELFRAAGNTVSLGLHGLPPDGKEPYPFWVPFATHPPPTNATTAGALAATAALAASMTVQGRVIWGPAFAGMAKRAAGDGSTPIKTFGEFAAQSGPGFAKFGCNLLASTLVAGSFRPLVDGVRKA